MFHHAVTTSIHTHQYSSVAFLVRMADPTPFGFVASVEWYARASNWLSSAAQASLRRVVDMAKALGWEVGGLCGGWEVCGVEQCGLCCGYRGRIGPVCGW